MHFDLVYEEIGEFGPFQKYIVLVGPLTSFYAGLLFVSTFFTLAIPDHRCALPGWANDTYSIQSLAHFEAVNSSIPPADADEKYIYDQCNLRYTDADGNKRLRPCHAWVYDKSIFQSTLAADSNAQMTFFGGLLVGSLMTGVASDRYGRKRTLVISSIFYFVAALSIAWTPGFIVYLIQTFCVGFFSVGNFMPVYVLCMEFVGPSYRRIAGLIGGFHWLFGNLALGALGYGIRDWVTLQIVTASPGILFQLWFFPESPRWLFMQGRLAESEAIIRKAARWNKTSLPDGFFLKVFQTTPEPNQAQIWHLFRNRTLGLRTLIVFFNWFAVCLAYYGLTLNSGDLGGDLYVNFFLTTLMDLPASLACILLLERTGRKPLLVGGMITGGVGCLSTVFTIIYGGKDPEYETATRILALIGKFGASVGFTMAYMYSGEFFPTVVRNAGMGSSSCMARVGGILAPYIADLIVFGALSLTAGILALYLPETRGRKLPETIEQGIKFGSEEIEYSPKEAIVNQAFDGQEENTKL
ncbi:ORCT-like protein [Mya arenaria]|uniref:ORCT-like protein n=1 Tax=Mya arenaria TaxID=6604 RepID=A0ABY7DI31_MYAAR|nr:ORCT-like protein [Mya arenaria]